MHKSFRKRSLKMDLGSKLITKKKGVGKNSEVQIKI